RVVTAPMSRRDRLRYREQAAADLEGAPELGVSPASVALGHLRTAPSVINEGDVMPHPVGPLTIRVTPGPSAARSPSSPWPSGPPSSSAWGSSCSDRSPPPGA